MTPTIPTTKADLGAASTADQVANMFSNECKGKVVLITGANTGLGLETARVLASQGSHVIIGSRSEANGQKAMDSIKREFPNAQVEVLSLNLSSLKAVKKAADQFLSKHRQLHVLVNNAGVMACPKSSTEDGLENQFGVNHLAHFYLTSLLLPLLEKTGSKQQPSRIVNLSSMAHFIFPPNEGILFDDLNGDKYYDPWQRYGQSKLANVLFTNELQRRYGSRNVISVSLHPGTIMSTELTRHSSLMYYLNMMSAVFRGPSGSFSLLLSQRQKSIPEGSATTVLCVLDPEIVPGAYYYDCKMSQGEWVHEKVKDQDLAKKLWDVSDQMVKDILSK